MTTCQNIPPLDVLKSVVYSKLPASFKVKVTDLALIMEEVGDGNIDDDFLRKPMGPKRGGEFVARLEGLGWLVRLENGYLTRAGMLAPHPQAGTRVEAEEEPSSVNADTIRMQIVRGIAKGFEEIRQELGLPPRTKTEQAPRKSRTNSIAAVNEPARESEQTAHSEPNSAASPHAGASESDSESDPILLFTKGESDSDSDSESDPRDRCMAFGMAAVYDALVAKSIAPELAVEATARTYNQLKGEQRPERAMIKYAIRVADKLKTERDAKARSGQGEWALPHIATPASGYPPSKPQRAAPTCSIQRPPPLTEEQQAASLASLRQVKSKPAAAAQASGS